MTFVNITALAFPEGAQAEIERRFAARKKAVDSFEGFLGFELLRPVIGEDRYFVVTRWDSRENYEKWVAARPTGGQAHGRARRRRAPGNERGAARIRSRPARRVTRRGGAKPAADRRLPHLFRPPRTGRTPQRCTTKRADAARPARTRRRPP